ncbi:MAG: sigma-54-dependent Fis family transcriptional regulator [Rhodospirillales bacterium]|jgi:two-component system, NtrC family, nitrogen regulation response regulator NtrX|nr:sigma-54-dependent Fis family transcriptional regulator [Rhodospirillales bacterium]
MAHDILIVDDEADIRALTSGILQDEGFQTREAGDSNSALGSIETRQPSLVLLDIWLQGSELDGLDILKIIARDHPYVPVVIMSGHGTVESAVAAIKDGAYDFIEKPFAADRLVLAVERATEAMRLKRENEELRIRAGTETELVGESAGINLVRQTIERVAPTNSRVLITGPAGSGKEVVARMLHARSRRADAPFVVVNCANMDPGRVETELFGTEGSGDQGGRARKAGMFEAAHMGTLLLDAVDDMPLETQGKIVRVLQEQTFDRVGGGTRVEVDVRVVASTSSNLAERMSAGEFREDLFFRLNVVPIDVPSLLDRRDDIPFLALHFMKRAAEAAGQQPQNFGEDAIVALQAYDWPGNVRELRNVVEWLLIMAPNTTGEVIRADMLPAAIIFESPVRPGGDGNSEIMSLPLRDAREIFEREYLAAQIKRFGGNISKTAEFVGMERSALHRKLKSLGVGEENSRAV